MNTTKQSLDLNKVKDKRTYILPSGSKLYFTNKKYTCSSAAQEALREMLSCGLSTSKIRTFYRHKISSSNFNLVNNICD